MSNKNKQFTSKQMDLDKPNQKHKPDSMDIDTVPKNISESKPTKPTKPTKPISSYVQIDSAQRKKHPTLLFDEKIYNLEPYPLTFVDKSTKIAINISNHSIQQTDRIVLFGCNSEKCHITKNITC